MKKFIFLYIGLFFGYVSYAQGVQYYENDRGERHICGAFPIDALEKDSIFQKWYRKNYLDFNILDKKRGWVKNLKITEVEVYLGTWCGDSKRWVPRFIKLWDALGLRRSQLTLTGLYDFVDGKYKQGPNAEEKNKDIHRVPTFIFKQNGKEIARIVEFPNNDLETDLAQIALGYPSIPNYRSANPMLALFKSNSNDMIKNSAAYMNEIYQLVKGPNELNTLGYVLMESGNIEAALTVFYYNTLFYEHNPNVYDSYAEALAKSGQIKESISNYEKVLLLDRSNHYAREQIQKLKNK